MNKKWTISISVIFFFILTAGYLTTGIYSLQSGQSALILRFGKVVDEVTASGIHYHLPYPVDRSVRLYVSEVKKVSIHELSENTGQRKIKDYDDFMNEMERTQSRRLSLNENFTGDENLVVANSVISYDVKNPKDYLFNITNVNQIIKAAGLNILCSELAKMTVDDVMTTGKSVLKLVMKEKIQAKLDELRTGVRIISVELTDIAPPQHVLDSFKAVSDARVKKQEIIKDSEGYANSKIPKARGSARSLLSSANAYAEELINSARSKAEAFSELLNEYERNPEIISRQCYLETIQKIYIKNEIKIDSNPANSIYYIEGK